MRRFWRATGVLAFILVIGACGSASSRADVPLGGASTATASQTPGTSPVPTASAQSTPTPPPKSTPTMGTPTMGMPTKPTATPRPGSHPTPTPTPRPPAVASDPAWQSWLQFGGNAEHSGSVGDGTITPGNVGGLHQYWAASVGAPAESAPVLAGAVPVNGGRRAILYITEKNGTLVAFDANSGAQLWSDATYGPGWTYAAPAVDDAQQYVYSYGLDGRVHKYDAATGQEEYGGWPVTVTYAPGVEQGSSALTIGNGWLYVALSGYPGDVGYYVGHVVAINLSNAATRVWNAVCANQTWLIAPTSCGEDLGGIWSRAGVVADPQTGRVFVAVGNALFDPGNGDWGLSLVALAPDLSYVADSYTPNDTGNLNANDLDLGSTAPALLPWMNGRLLLVQGGKDGVLRVLDRRNLSGQGGPGHTGGELATFTAPGGCAVFTAPLVYSDNSGVWVIVMNDCGAAGWRIGVNGDGSVWVNQQWSTGEAGTSPALGGGVVFGAQGGQLFALNPTSGQQLWSAGIGGIFGQSPIVADGRVYITDDNGGVRCYGQ